LQRETANLPANKLDDALQRGEITIDDLSDSQIEELRKGAKLLQRAGEHFEKGARLNGHGTRRYGTGTPKCR
jgi:hypothetical protein